MRLFISGFSEMRAKVFSVLFLIMLLAMPVSFPLAKHFIDTENHENRAYAEFPTVSPDSLGVFSIGFERYFEDHLPYKNQMTKLNATIEEASGIHDNLLLYYNEESVIHGKDGWLFYNSAEYESTVNDYLCNNLYDNEELERLATGYQALNDQYAAQGIEFVFLIPTNKEQIYPEYMPDTLVPEGDVSRTDQLVSYLREYTTVPVLYTKEVLLEAKDICQVFYKYDSHWNLPGGFVGDQLLRELLQGESDDLSEYEIRQLPADYVGDLAVVSGVQDSLSEHPLEVVGYKPEVTVTLTSEEESEEAKIMSYVSDAADQRKVLMIKDSFCYSMAPYLSRDFGETIFTTDTAIAKQIIAEQHPDIVILEITERHYYRAEHQWEELVG